MAVPSQFSPPLLSRESNSLASLTNWLQHPGGVASSEKHRQRQSFAARQDVAVAAEEAKRALEEARVELSETRAQLDENWQQENENALLDELLQTAAEAVSMEVSQPVSEIRFVETPESFHREGVWDTKWENMLKVLDDGIGSMTVAMGEDAAKAKTSRYSSPAAQQHRSIGTPKRMRVMLDDDMDSAPADLDGQLLRTGIAENVANSRLAGASNEVLAEEARAISEALQEDDWARAEAGRRLFRTALMMMLG